ncbi:hypothetical protein ADICYQ_0188 [Cyclobacterium qasimii M12-11B]|uniref:Uncharacterized protein n=1 Tax=Cyclobacterium qasimii M12-11B TaxID=641524 RepID=S7VNT9_9BACT|nr:hypothetical protein ADICYQ_0188 [Cyclobacterium qasimii M12-11B]
MGFLLIEGIALGGVTHMPETGGADEVAHVPSAVRLTHLAIGFLQVQGAAIGSGDSRGVLAAVLQQQECVVDLLVDGLRRDDTDNAAHAFAWLPEVEETVPGMSTI